jgi:Spy/CpxP family protein refolding chaperone
MRSLHLAGLTLALTLSTSAVAASAQATSSSPTPAATAPGAQAAPTRQHHHLHYRELFRGVQLTPDQTQKIKAIHSQFRTQARPVHEQMRTARSTLRNASGDTAAIATARTQMKSARTQFAALRSQFLSDTRGTLTPEQQTQFDANIATMKAAWERHQKRERA